MSEAKPQLSEWRTEFEAELCNNILPFWAQYGVDRDHGGFYGRISNRNEIDRQAGKGSVQNARILWTYSAAYRLTANLEYRALATHAYEFLVRCHLDPDFGGVYWEVDFAGKPRQTKKQIYALAFAIYGLSEYFAATGDLDALLHACALFEQIEKHSRDHHLGGYLEAFTREWSLLEDLRLSSKDANEKKTMNTHLHILEAYSTLYRVSGDVRVGKALAELIEVFLSHIIRPEDGHFGLFFDEHWKLKSRLVSFGHDIEGSWLLSEAVETLVDSELHERTRNAALRMAEAVLKTGVAPDGSLLYEADETGIIDDDRHWWPQAEAVVGLMNAYQLSADPRFLKASHRAWSFIRQNIVCREFGEWYWKVDRQGVPSDTEDKGGFWKSPYHNGRTCLEMMARIDTVIAGRANPTSENAIV